MCYQRRYPLAPLVARARLPMVELREVLGLSGSRWALMVEQGLTDVEADRFARRFRLHPVSVWGWTAYLEAQDDAEDVMAERDAAAEATRQRRLQQQYERRLAEKRAKRLGQMELV